MKLSRNNNKKKNHDGAGSSILPKGMLRRSSQKTAEEETNSSVDSNKKPLFRKLGGRRRSANNIETPTFFPKFSPPAKPETLLTKRSKKKKEENMLVSKQSSDHLKRAPIPQELPSDFFKNSRTKGREVIEGNDIKNQHERYPKVVNHSHHTTILQRNREPLLRQPSHSKNQVAPPSAGSVPPRLLTCYNDTLNNISAITLFAGDFPDLSQRQLPIEEEDYFQPYEGTIFPVTTKRSDHALQRSSSYSDFEKLKEVQEALKVFPKVDEKRVKQVLREKSFRTAMNVLTEENEVTVSAEKLKPQLMTVANDKIQIEKGPIIDTDTANEQCVNKTLPVDNNHKDENGAHDFSHTSIERLPSTLWRRSKGHNSIYPDLSHFDTSQMSQKSLKLDDDEYSKNSKIVNLLLPTLPPPSKIVRSNSFTSVLERDHVDLEQIQEIFPNVEARRANYLLRQHSLSTVMLVLASENTE